MPLVSLNRSGQFANQDGFVSSERVRRWIEGITRIVNNGTFDISALKPSYNVITTSDSPYAAVDNEYILCTMDGNITITLPASGRIHVSRSGASNTLTLTGTVNGGTNPILLGDGSSVSLAYIGTEFRYV
tara:strand:+ start:93 stop:482 length:390 start_codon:yes stop_codon:yes gene_type:complete